MIFGHVGDRYGRRAALVATQLVMGLSTFAIGLVPDHHKWGIATLYTVLFLRTCQGGSVHTYLCPHGNDTTINVWLIRHT